MPANDPNIDEVYSVRAGKFRRYSGEGLKQLLDAPTVLKNVRDTGRVVRGLAESRRLLKRLKPDIIFVKGGFVGVPVGLAAAQLKIPFVTHDSDAIPGLANRIIARWATMHAVALPKEAYPYPSAKTQTVGVPTNKAFKLVDGKLQAGYRHDLGLDSFERVVFVTGGGNGARQLNSIVVGAAPKILKHYPKLAIVHLSGRGLEAETEEAYKQVLPESDLHRIIIKGFVSDLYKYSGAADLIIGRGSATNLAEFAIQSKPCVIVPARQLGWTVKNTEALVKSGAVVSLSEDKLAADPGDLAKTCIELLDSKSERERLSIDLQKIAHPNAARELAQLIIKTAKNKTQNNVQTL